MGWYTSETPTQGEMIRAPLQIRMRMADRPRRGESATPGYESGWLLKTKSWAFIHSTCGVMRRPLSRLGADSSNVERGESINHSIPGMVAGLAAREHTQHPVTTPALHNSSSFRPILPVRSQDHERSFKSRRASRRYEQDGVLDDFFEAASRSFRHVHAHRTSTALSGARQPLPAPPWRAVPTFTPCIWPACRLQPLP